MSHQRAASHPSQYIVIRQKRAAQTTDAALRQLGRHVLELWLSVGDDEALPGADFVEAVGICIENSDIEVGAESDRVAAYMEGAASSVEAAISEALVHAQEVGREAVVLLKQGGAEWADTYGSEHDADAVVARCYPDGSVTRYGPSPVRQGDGPA